MYNVCLDTALDDLLLKTPAPVLDFDIISDTFDRCGRAFSGGWITCAMKANANPVVWKNLIREYATRKTSDGSQYHPGNVQHGLWIEPFFDGFPENSSRAYGNRQRACIIA